MAELEADSLLLDGLPAEGRPAVEVLRAGLGQAVARGTFLTASYPAEHGTETVFFLNSPKGRAGVLAVERGEWRPGDEMSAPSAERPNVFRLYEENIGPLTPLIADTLRDADETYPAAWIEDALRIAVENNVRKWRYVQAILEDWRTRGRDEREDRGDSEKARRRYVEGKFADFIEH
jgi:DnaD/phage-associated family protein